MDRGWLAACLFFSARFCALGQQVVAVEGTVVDSDTGFPVAGAQVVLCYSTSQAPLDTTATDASGRFRISIREAGQYAIEVSINGAESARAKLDIDDSELAPDVTPRVHKVILTATRSGAIRGRVRDGDTEKPIRLLTVRALRLWWRRGVRQITEERVAFTDDEGAFRIDPVPPGEYLLEVSNHVPEGKASAKRYPVVFWPGGDPQNTHGTIVRGGGEIDTGTIEYSRGEFPKLKVKMTAECSAASVFPASVEQRVASGLLSRGTISLACDGPTTIDWLSPGTYRLRPVFALARDIRLEPGTEHEIELRAALSILSGKLECDCESPPGDGRPLRIILEGDDGSLSGGFVPEDGAFRGPIRFAGSMRLRLEGLRAGVYVKEVRVNGASGGLAFALPEATAAAIDIILADRPASLTGTALKHGKPAAGYRVIASRWPLPGQDMYPDFSISEIDDAGAFRLQDLAPGTYRVAAVDVSDWSRKDEPGAIAGWLAAGVETTLAEKEAGRVAIEIRP